MNPDAQLLDRFRAGGVLFDGGLGTMLIAAGFETGTSPQEWNRSRPSVLLGIHKAYLEAGAAVVSTNTFDGSPSRLARFGLEAQMEQLNTAGVKLARQAVSEFGAASHGSRSTSRDGPDPRVPVRLVALDLGPSGRMLPPVGGATEQELRADYTAQIRGIEERFDLVLIETIYDLREGLLALETAKEITGLPVAVSLTFNKTRRGFHTIMGDAAADAMKRLEAAGADVVGANCSITSVDMLVLADTLRDSTTLPVICQSNAGSPRIRDGVAVYDQSPEAFAEDALRLFEKGINAVGGCCGTTPEFIRRVAEGMAGI
jgi:5-methyltetrahydrofolate--homocysteine methyltransferase